MSDQAQGPNGNQSLSNLYSTASSADFTSPYPPSQHTLQEQQAHFNSQTGAGRVGGIPDPGRSAMWQQLEQNHKSAMTPQQLAAQNGNGSIGNHTVSMTIPYCPALAMSRSQTSCSVRSAYNRIAHRALAARTVRASSLQLS